MTQENKELLLKDLCARLPYRVKSQCGSSETNIGEIVGINVQRGQIKTRINYYNIEHIKPYLRPMSSLTEEEKDFLSKNSFSVNSDGAIDNNCDITGQGWDNCYVDTESVENVLEMFNSHHLDWRGLIEKGIVLEAPKDMYKF